MNKKKEIFLLVSLILLLFTINYKFLDTKVTEFLEESEFGIVERVIDGDTLEINKTSIRLLGINTPERGEKYYQEAKDFLSNLTLNKSVKLEYVGERYDKYKRKLAYIIIGEKNINIEIVKNGFANYYFYDGRDIHSKELEDAWEICLNNNKYLCEKSNNPCSPCIQINSTHITNSCSFSCNITHWIIKGEGREKFIFNETMLNSKGSAQFNVNLTNSGGSLFLRDENNKLVLWGNY